MPTGSASPPAFSCSPLFVRLFTCQGDWPLARGKPDPYTCPVADSSANAQWPWLLRPGPGRDKLQLLQRQWVRVRDDATSPPMLLPFLASTRISERPRLGTRRHTPCTPCIQRIEFARVDQRQGWKNRLARIFRNRCTPRRRGGSLLD